MPEDLIVHPFGEVESYLVDEIHRALQRQFSLGVSRGERLPIPARSLSSERRQHLSTEFLKALASSGQDDALVKLGITKVDLFVPELNFVFGEASTTLRAAVFSTARLDPVAYREPEDRATLIRRATIEAVHEVGHVFGLGHCKQSNCVMWFSNTLAESDRKGSNFCQSCAAQLKSLMRAGR